MPLSQSSTVYRYLLSLFAAAKLGLSILVALGVLLFLAPYSLAQGTNGNNATGTKPYWSYLQNRETISPSSGNLMVKIPLLHLPGRAGHDLDLSMTYNSGATLSLEQNSFPVYGGTETMLFYDAPQATWGLSFPVMTPFLAQPTDPNQLGTGSPVYQGGATLLTADGAKYTFGMAAWDCDQVISGSITPCSPNWPVVGDDSQAGIVFDGNATFPAPEFSQAQKEAPTAFFPNGDRLVDIYSVGTLDVDPNGNYITYNYTNSSITDTLGRVVTFNKGASGQFPVSGIQPNSVEYYNSEGTQQTITFNYASPAPSGITPPAPTQQVFQNHPPSTIGACGSGEAGTCFQSETFAASKLLSSIVFPNGSSYSFLYDGIGDLIKVGYPGGGYTRYDYTLEPRTFWSPNTGTYYGVAPQVTAKHTCSDEDVPYGTTALPAGNTCTVQELTTTYTPTVSQTEIYNAGNTVTDPDGTVTAYTYNTVPATISNFIKPRTITADYAPVELFHTITDAQGYVREAVTNTYESDNLHLKTRATSRLHGLSTLESWTNVSAELMYGGQSVPGSGPNYTAYYWTTTSLLTSDLATGSALKREDYTLSTPAFNPAQAYFVSLKLYDKLFDYGQNAYTTQTQNQYDQNTLASSGVSVQHATQGTARNNLTASLHYSSTDSAYIGTQRYFDDAGNLVKAVDALNYTTSYSFADQWSGQGTGCFPNGIKSPLTAYPTQITNALGQSASAIYNPCTGTKSASADANSQTTSYTYWPKTEQLESVSYPDGGSTSFCYENTSPCTGVDSSAVNYTVTTQSVPSPDTNVVAEEDYDGLGRSISTKLMSDWCVDETDTTYNNREWVATKTFPYCEGGTPLLTTYAYNAIGYMTSKQVTGSNARTWTYPNQNQSTTSPPSNQSVTEQDELGNNVSVSSVDSLGRLVQVMEPGPSNTPTYETDYTLDAANNMRQADQWGGSKGSTDDRKRVFIYDTLSRLTSSTNPEAGTITYSYDKDSNLKTNTDARGIVTTLAYDTLNRLTQTTYSDGTPTECFAYDSAVGGTAVSYPIGRLTGEWTQTGNCPAAGTAPTASALVTERLIGGGVSPYTGYDPMGRIAADLQCPSEPCATPYQSLYTYNKAGHLSTEQHPGTPAGSVVLTHTYDGAAHPQKLSSSWSDATHPATLFEADSTTKSTMGGNPYTPCGLQYALVGGGSPDFVAGTMSRSMDARCRPLSETDITASTPTAISAVKATASVNISLNEQSIAGNSTHSTAAVTISSPYGGDQYSSACSCYDNGFVEILVIGQYIGTTPYTDQDQQGSTTAGIASALVGSINGNSQSPVTASVSGSTVNLTSKAVGSGTNYTLTTVNESTNSNFPNPSFVGTASGSTMTGGTTGSGATVYDSGTVTITVGSLSPLSLSWSNADTTATVVSRLVSLINGTAAYQSVVTASAGTGQVNLTAVNGGTAGNLSLQTSVTFNSSTFTHSSLQVSSPSAMSGGANGYPQHAATQAYQYSSAAWAANGNLSSVNDTVIGTQTFTSYDHMNRLTGESIASGGNTGTLSWSYDAFGNRLSQSGAGKLNFSMTQTSATFNGSSMQNGTQMSGSYSNRMDGVNYDASGDVLSNGTTTFSYDGASRLKTSGTTCYVYNAEGVRTAKGTWSSGVCGSITSRYILGPGGQQVTELTGTGASWLHTNVFNGGALLATYDGNGLHFRFTDWLGTERAQVNATGTMEQTCLSLPFGDSLACSGSGTDATEHHFTGKEHDAESGLDYFGARYYQSSFGRWMSPDWSAKVAPIPYAKMDDPQTLNLYAYVGNKPLVAVDADGHDNSGISDMKQYMAQLKYGAYQQEKWEEDMRDFGIAVSNSVQALFGSHQQSAQQTNAADNNYTFTLNGQKMSSLVGPNGESTAAFSGNGADRNDPSKTGDAGAGPLPTGLYYIVDRPSGGRGEAIRDMVAGTDRETWFGLFRADGKVDDHTTVGGASRGNFRLHPIGPLGISEGCITVNSLSAYVRIAFQLMSAKPATIPGTDTRYYGTVTVK